MYEESLTVRSDQEYTISVLRLENQRLKDEISAYKVVCAPRRISALAPCAAAAISAAVVRRWTSMLAPFSNCCGIQAPGVWASSSVARAIAPFMPFSRGVSSKRAP